MLISWALNRAALETASTHSVLCVCAWGVFYMRVFVNKHTHTHLHSHSHAHPPEQRFMIVATLGQRVEGVCNVCGLEAPTAGQRLLAEHRKHRVVVVPELGQCVQAEGDIQSIEQGCLVLWACSVRVCVLDSVHVHNTTHQDLGAHCRKERLVVVPTLCKRIECVC